MPQASEFINNLPVVKSILHPTDYLKSSEAAFYHALKIAVITRSELRLLHASPLRMHEDRVNFDWFPGVRKTLEKWDLIPPNSPKKAVTDLGINVEKRVFPGTHPVKAVMTDLEREPADLLVLATSQTGGKATWMGESTLSEPMARKSKLTTLFLPNGVPGFVSAEDGSISLKRFLLPVQDASRSADAVEAACRTAAALQVDRPIFTLLHVGPQQAMPELDLPEVEGWTWEQECVEGPVVESIVAGAERAKAGLIVMTTSGHDSFMDVFRGSTTEQVLREASCPLLAVSQAR